MTVQDLPAVNAALNGASAVLLFAGWRLIRAGRVAAHRAAMLTALLLSAAFLACYLVYHYHVGSVRFQGPQPVRLVYLTILVTHTVLAVVNLPLIIRTVYLAANERFEDHRRVARWTFPSWMYVSVTGVVVYAMNYVLYPAR